MQRRAVMPESVDLAEQQLFVALACMRCLLGVETACGKSKSHVVAMHRYTSYLGSIVPLASKKPSIYRTFHNLHVLFHGTGAPEVLES